jgi:hypothetical protein
VAGGGIVIAAVGPLTGRGELGGRAGCTGCGSFRAATGGPFGRETAHHGLGEQSMLEIR